MDDKLITIKMDNEDTTIKSMKDSLQHHIKAYKERIREIKKKIKNGDNVKFYKKLLNEAKLELETLKIMLKNLDKATGEEKQEIYIEALKIEIRKLEAELREVEERIEAGFDDIYVKLKEDILKEIKERKAKLKEARKFKLTFT